MGRLAVLLTFCLVLTACGGIDSTTPLAADDLRAVQAEWEAAAAAQVDANNYRDLDLVRRLYPEDVVLVDGEDDNIGIDELVATYKFLWAQFPDYTSRHTATYVGRGDGVVVIEQFGIDGYTEDNPFFEYQLLEIEQGLIAIWTPWYDMDTRPFFGRGGMDEEAVDLLDRYIVAWNSGDPTEIGAVYAPTAVREDGLFGESATGRDEIEDSAMGFFDRRGDLTWQLLHTIAVRSHTLLAVGGVFAISDSADEPCAIEVLVLLEGSGDLIELERVYYEADSLLTCGWAA